MFFKAFYLPVGTHLFNPERSYSRLFTKTLLVMRLTAVLLTAAVLQVSANAVSQTVKFSGTDVPLKQIFSVIREQTGYFVMYSDAALEGRKPVTVNANNLPLERFLEKILEGQGLDFSIRKKTVFIRELEPDSERRAEKSPPEIKLAWFAAVSVRVLDEDGKPLSGATVTNKKSKTSKITDDAGVCVIQAETGDIIEVTYVGYSAQRVTVKDVKSKILIALKPNAILEEAVVNLGVQQVKQKYLTGSVTSLKMDSILRPGVTTVDKMLEGRVPGMTYMLNSGQVGATPKLRIRGTNTYLGSREPLWVVDGVIRTDPFPIAPQKLNDPDFVNLLGNAISGLTPFDIDQIDVLKDATAAALYGVRAANGVIVITTKKGKPGPPSVNYSGTTNITFRPRYNDGFIYMMNSKERVDVSREMVDRRLLYRNDAYEAYERALIDYYSGYIDFGDFQKLVNRAETVNTDWLDAALRNAVTTKHNMSVSGGSHAAPYRISLGYVSEPGVIKKESNEQYNGTFNLQLYYRKWTANVNLMMNKSRRRYTPQNIGVLNYVFGTSRTIPLYNEDGTLYFYSDLNNARQNSSENVFKTMNILHEMDNTSDIIENSEHSASVNLTYEITKGIQLRSLLSYSNSEALQSTTYTENSNYIIRSRGISNYPGLAGYNANFDLYPYGGELNQLSSKRQNYSASIRLNVDKYLDKNNFHHFTGELATEVLSQRMNTLNKTERGYLPDRGHSFAYVDLTKYVKYAEWLATNYPVIGVGLNNSLRTSINAIYSFKDRYIFSGSTGQEFSNAFGNRSNEKILPSWSLAAKWNMHEENFLKNSDFIHQLALRVSTGTRGNMIIGQNPNAVITKQAFNTYYNENASTLKSFPNPDLSWEMTRDYSAQVDFTLWKGKFSGTVGYSYAKTTNAFMNKKVSNFNGVTSYVVNGGILENRTVEVMLNFTLIDQRRSKNGFYWRFDPMFSETLNKLLNTAGRSKSVLVDEAAITYADYLSGSVPVDGKSVNTFYSYRFKGLDHNYGFPIFYGMEPENKEELRTKYNQMNMGDVFDAILVESGRREPVLQGGFSNTFAYKNFNLSMLFTYSLGNKIRLYRIVSGEYGVFMPSSQQNLRKEFINRWRYPGDELYTNIPGVMGATNYTDYDKLGWFNNTSYSLLNPVAQNYYQMYDDSDLRVVKGDYLKLSSIQLTYHLSSRILERFSCKNANIVFGADNVFVIKSSALKGQDPTQSGSAPDINLSVRPTYSFTLNLGF